ncbi:hypothetical protein [Methanosarcina mazei]|uniref:Uncharacterized protein n=1 Tax=Methanosarcina mazei TaxID=2209 RepID=A0A0F8RH79_METMZ|nr:hypothetical protein [Methanosarcina mazei]KKG06136.1 hypothetical protein DU47_12825 [Methanosarcina mazei]KKH86878.1 hypothetical protein DU80_07040 [Methanosarcina mazei]
MRISSDEKGSRAGHWTDPETFIDGKEMKLQNWYKYQRGKKLKICLSNRVDYYNTVSKHRSLYWTLNIFDADIFELDYNQLPDKSAKISRKYTTGYTFGIDIDKEKGCDIHSPDIKKAVEDMAQFFTDRLREYAPNSVYVAYSGGGIYVLVHHGIFIPYFKRFRNRDDWDLMLLTLLDAFDMLIGDMRDEFFKLHPEQKGKVKPDQLNGSQRVFKTLFSLHKKLDYAVIPLDPKNIKIDFKRATIPLKPEVIMDGEEWYKGYDNGSQFLNQLLKPFLEKVYSKKRESHVSEGGHKRSQMPIIDFEKWPPCMQNLYNMPACGEGATRALAIFASFLGQIGIEEETARSMFDELAHRWDARSSNIFESYYGKMNVPTCKRLISDDNRGFPKGVSIKTLGVCKMDMRCLNSPSPYYYADRKAKINT